MKTDAIDSLNVCDAADGFSFFETYFDIVPRELFFLEEFLNCVLILFSIIIIHIIFINFEISSIFITFSQGLSYRCYDLHANYTL